MHGIPGHDKSVDSIHVIVGDTREMIVRERGIEIATGPIGPIMHGAQKIALRPRADAGFHIRRDVGGINRSEHCFQWPPARVRFAAGLRMTCRAVADSRELRALRHGLAVEHWLASRRVGRRIPTRVR